MKTPLLPVVAAALAGLFVFARRRQATSSASPGGPRPLRAGVPYLFIVRLNPGVTDEQVNAALEPKGVESLILSPAVNPPFWATLPTGSVPTLPTGSVPVWSNRVASFKATPQGNGSVSLGDPFYGVGRLESLARLDGMSIDAEGPSV